MGIFTRPRYAVDGKIGKGVSAEAGRRGATREIQLDWCTEEGRSRGKRQQRKRWVHASRCTGGEFSRDSPTRLAISRIAQDYSLRRRPRRSTRSKNLIREATQRDLASFPVFPLFRVSRPYRTVTWGPTRETEQTVYRLPEKRARTQCWYTRICAGLKSKPP